MVLISVKALTLLLWYLKILLSSKIVCSGHFSAVSWDTALYSGWAIFHLDEEEEEEVQLFHILFPICAWQAKVPGKGFNLSAPTTCHMLGQTSLLVGQLFWKGGETMGPPTDNVRCSTTSISMVMWKLTTLLETFSLLSKITKMSELVGNLFLFFAVPSLLGLFLFQFLWCTHTTLTVGGDHPSTKKRN